ncbi:MAG: ATP-binding cassette domain-containing protein, partial [Olsenella sp.]|nr:ATP-binding cassette domain-containing protein [Olsenella sp.]
MAFVEFRDVTKKYRMGDVEVRAVDGMTFDIERGELAVIVGPSGAGKTTVLNMLGGMDSATSGTIRLGDRVVSSLSERELTQYRRHDIGFVFQFYNLVQNLTARENVELA